MLAEKFETLYRAFRLELYRRVFSEIKEHEPSITTSEFFCAESILLLGDPTVNEFAEYLGISPSNAAYKVKQLIEKGYIVKRADSEDGRVFRLHVTDKFSHFYDKGEFYGGFMIREIETKLKKEDVALLEQIFDKIIQSENSD